jgi:hypothetical protein
MTEEIDITECPKCGEEVYTCALCTKTVHENDAKAIISREVYCYPCYQRKFLGDSA